MQSVKPWVVATTKGVSGPTKFTSACACRYEIYRNKSYEWIRIDYGHFVWD